MSFRSTFYSPGGFTTQRLDLILKKRKDEGPGSNTQEAGGSPSRSSSTSPTTSSTLEENIKNKHAGALGRWRQKMAAQNSSVGGGGSSSSETSSWSGSKYRSSSSSLDNDYNSSTGLPRSSSKRLEYGDKDIADYKYRYNADNDSSRLDRHHSLVNLPRRRKEQSRSSSGVNGISNTSTTSLDSMGNVDRKTHLDNDLRGSRSNQALSTERPLTSRRFQELFSSSNDGDKDDESGDNSPDSLEGDESDSDGKLSDGDKDEVFSPYSLKRPGSSLTRSLSSASTILRTGWSPSGRLLRDRYNISSDRDDLKATKKVKGTPSNWAAWKGGVGDVGVPKGKVELDGLIKDSTRNSKDQHVTDEDSKRAKRKDDSAKGHARKLNSIPDHKPADQKINSTGSRSDPDGIAKAGDSRGLDHNKGSHNKKEAINKGPSQSDSVDSISKGNITGGLTPEAITEHLDLPVPQIMPPLPTSLHLKSFPGFVQSNNWAQPPDSSSARRHGHWGGHVPAATSGHKPPEWYLYKGSKSGDPDQSSPDQPLPNKQDKSVGALDFLFHDTDRNEAVSESSEESETEDDPPLPNSKGVHDENDNIKFRDDLGVINSQGVQHSHMSGDESNKQASPDGNNDQGLEGTLLSEGTRVKTCESSHDANLGPPIDEKASEKDYRPAHNSNSLDLNTKQGASGDHGTLPTETKEDISGAAKSPTQKGLNKDPEGGDNLLIGEPLDPLRDSSPRPGGNKYNMKVETGQHIPGEDSPNDNQTNKADGTSNEEGDGKVEVEGESAKSPRVSFSDHLKVVPPSPSAKRKQWPTSASSTNSEATTTTGPRPWDKSGKTPVKGILQNGRKEGDLVLKPEPDNSEMRRQDTDEEESNSYVTKRHSFSTSRDMSTRQRYATFMNEARRNCKPKPTPQAKVTPANTDRKVTKVPDSSRNDGQSSYKPSAKSGVQMRVKNKSTPSTDRSRRHSWREDEYRSGYQEKRASTSSLSANTHLSEQRDRAKSSNMRGSVDNVTQGKSVKDEKMKDPDAIGFTLSFKDFMETRKKRGTMVLPKSQERSEEKNEGRSKASRDMTQKMDAQTGNAVTLNSLKQKRQKDLEESGPGSGDVDIEESTEQKSTATDNTGGDPEETEHAGLKSKSESSHRWSFRSKSKKKEQDGSGSDSPSPKKKESSGGAVQSISNFFKRSKKGKKDKESKDSGNTNMFYGEEDKSGATDMENGSKPQDIGTSGNIGQDADEGFSASSPEGECRSPKSSFTLGPHGHNDNNSDRLSMLFNQGEQSDVECSERSKSDSSQKYDELDTSSNADKSTISTRDDFLSRSESDSPALSAISSTDGTGSSRNKHYQKPDYKHFLDMDSLVASITTNSPNNDADTSSGVSGTGSDSASVSGIGSLEDLAMALLEQELREEGLLEGEPGKGDPSQTYQDRILSIKSDLQKFSAHLGRALKKQHKHADSEHAPSVSEVSFTSTRSSRYGMRDPTAEAKPVTDPLLRSKLKTARSPGAKVTSRDQKILELMMQKRESERAAEAKREALRRAWETEKEQENAVKTTAEVRRRESLVKMRHQQKDLYRGSRHGDSRESLISNSSERRGSDIDRQDIEDALKYKENKWASQSQRLMELRPPPTRRYNSRILKFRSMDDMRNKCERPWVANTNGLVTEKEKKMAERRIQNMQRKKSQEDRIAQQKREQEEMARLVKERQERELKRANSLKETREQEAIMQRKLKSYYHKKKVDSKLSDMKRKSREDVNSLQAAIEMKQATAQSHLNDLTQRRRSSLRKSTGKQGSMTDLDTRISRSRENQQKLQEEISAWHTDLLNYRKSMAKKAEEQAKILVQEKAKRAAVDRKHKEKAQKDNLKKLLDQEEEWKADVEATIAMKDARARMIQMEKEETVQESRAMAAASQRMREELRSAYSSDNIDQLSRRAEIEAKIGLTSGSVNPGISSTTKNMSTLTLG